MKITLTIEVNDNGITVSPGQVDVVNKENSVTTEVASTSKIKTTDNSIKLDTFDLNSVVIPENMTTIGEDLPKGRAQQIRKTTEYPYNVLDAKQVLKDNNVNLAQLSRAMCNFPSAKLRNIFRYDYRRFTKEEFNVILKAIDNIVKEREINL